MATLKLKKPAPAPAAAAAPAAPGAPAADGIFVSSRHANPLEAQDAAPVKKGKWTVFAILSIITTILFLALIMVMYMDLSALKLA